MAYRFEDLFNLDKREAEKLFGSRTAARLIEAVEDFNAVISGRKPIHAGEDTSKPRLSDGGTTYYKGNGYLLTVVMSLNGIMRKKEYVSGYIYGPMIAFDEEIMQGNYPQIQHLAFYPEMLLKDLIRRMQSAES